MSLPPDSASSGDSDVDNTTFSMIKLLCLCRLVAKCRRRVVGEEVGDHSCPTVKHLAPNKESERTKEIRGTSSSIISGINQSDRYNAPSVMTLKDPPSARPTGPSPLVLVARGNRFSSSKMTHTALRTVLVLLVYTSTLIRRRVRSTHCQKELK